MIDVDLLATHSDFRHRFATICIFCLFGDEFFGDFSPDRRSAFRRLYDTYSRL